MNKIENKKHKSQLRLPSVAAAWEAGLCAAAVGGDASALAAHATQRSHRAHELSLDSWHSADDSKSLAGINLRHGRPLHHFIDLQAWVFV